jgi:hypothetical protein
MDAGTLLNVITAFGTFAAAFYVLLGLPGLEAVMKWREAHRRVRRGDRSPR